MLLNETSCSLPFGVRKFCHSCLHFSEGQFFVESLLPGRGKKGDGAYGQLLQQGEDDVLTYPLALECRQDSPIIDIRVIFPIGEGASNPDKFIIVIGKHHHRTLGIRLLKFLWLSTPERC